MFFLISFQNPTALWCKKYFQVDPLTNFVQYSIENGIRKCFRDYFEPSRPHKRESKQTYTFNIQYTIHSQFFFSLTNLHRGFL